MLFRSPQENYNPQIHTEELSLTVNMEKDFAVHNKVLSRFERYNKFTSFLFHTGRVDGGAVGGLIKRPSGEEVYDNAYRAKFKSINIMPAVSMGAALLGGWHQESAPQPDMSAVVGVTYAGGANAGNIATYTLFSVAIKHEPSNNIFGDKFNPQDSFVLEGGLGTVFYITRVRPSSTGDHYVLDGKTIGPAIDFKVAGLAEDEVLMEGGNYYGEGSMKGYQRHNKNYWKIFYSFMSRYTLSFTGNALRQKQLKVIWTGDQAGKANKTGGYWQFEQEWLADEMFSLMLELSCRFSASSMDPSTHAWFENFGKNNLTMTGLNPEAGITPPRTPDGWIRSIKDTIDMTYDVNDGLSPYLLQSVMTLLANNSPAGAQGNQFVIIGDAIAYQNFDSSLKRLIGWNVSGGSPIAASHNTNMVYNIQSGQDIKLGFNIKSYEYLGNEIMFIQDELFSHPGLNNRNGGLVGTGNLYILNVTPVEGVSNFELFTGGNGRYFRKKYVDGMHSLDAIRDKSMFASTGFDGGFCHYLSELFPITYFEDTCAVIRGSNKFTGGALTGNAKLPNFPLIR
jgi:hypothetical protein